MTSVTTDLARDLLEPGFPTMNKGILNSIMIAIIHTFSCGYGLINTQKVICYLLSFAYLQRIIFGNICLQPQFIHKDVLAM